MFTRRLLTLSALSILLLFGVFIGLTLDRLWFGRGPISQQIVAPAHAGSRESAATGPSSIEKRDKHTDVTRVVEAISPSVVTVGATRTTLVAHRMIDDFFFIPSVRYSHEQQRIPYLGSGFIVSDDGLVLTNFHVIDGSESFFITTPDGREFPATLVDADRSSDVALLRADPGAEKLPPPLTLADSSEILIGESVIAFGNPFGNLIEDSHPSVTVGHISALNRTFRPDRENRRVYQEMIQTDAAINPGNSGGPLIDINGQVVGMNTFIFSPSGGSTGVGFAIPASRLKVFLDEIREFGRLRALLLDFSFRTVRLRNGGSAVQVLGMDPAGPAAKAGLEPGDVILKTDGRAVATQEEFYILFASKHVGDTVSLEVGRPGREPFTVTYQVIEAPRNE